MALTGAAEVGRQQFTAFRLHRMPWNADLSGGIGPELTESDA